MKPFKLLKGYEEYEYTPLPEDTASWMWDSEFQMWNLDNRWSLTSITVTGIIEFLSLFPRFHIVPIHSITGNNIRHDGYSERNGWGFDIQREVLTIEYYHII